MLELPVLQDSLAALARESARARLLEGGTDTRYWQEAWFFLGLAATILAWCWRTWRDVHGAGPIGDLSGPVSRAAEPDESDAADPDAPVRLRCPACESVVGDTSSPLGYLTVCPACGRPITVAVVEGRPRVVLREA